ncbi:Uncharacterised protein [Mycobacteroides abscessus]|nr:Uncharacterised protein [Mycobacteroides abscessus]
MKPLPTISTRPGSSGSRMMSSLVWYGTPLAAITGGMTGREPAAITTCRASSTVPSPSLRRCTESPSASVPGSMNRASC